MPITFSVPDRRPISCPPPRMRARDVEPVAHDQRADALRPAQLVGRDQRHIRPAPGEGKRGSAPKAWVAVAARPAPRAGPARSRSRNWPACSVGRRSAPSPTPSPIVPFRSVRHAPRPRHARSLRATSPAPRQRQRRRLGRARGEDHLRGLRAHAAATCARARSTSAFAARPSAWTDDGLPTTSIAATIAARASARKRRRRVPVEIDAALARTRPLFFSQKYAHRNASAAGELPAGCAPADHTSSTTCENSDGTAGQGARSFSTTSDSRVWCRNT
jgi:hypothetical protein